MLPVQVRVDLGIMVMKVYSMLPRSSEQLLHLQMQYCVISRTPFLRGILLLCNQPILSPADCAHIGFSHVGHVSTGLEHTSVGHVYWYVDWVGYVLVWWQSVEATWHGYQEASIHVTKTNSPWLSPTPAGLSLLPGT